MIEIPIIKHPIIIDPPIIAIPIYLVNQLFLLDNPLGKFTP